MLRHTRGFTGTTQSSMQIRMAHEWAVKELLQVQQHARRLQRYWKTNVEGGSKVRGDARETEGETRNISLLLFRQARWEHADSRCTSDQVRGSHLDIWTYGCRVNLLCNLKTSVTARGRGPAIALCPSPAPHHVYHHSHRSCSHKISFICDSTGSPAR